MLQDNWHHVTLTAWSVDGVQLKSGTLNINTTSPYVWRSILETYNSTPGAVMMSAGTLASVGTNLANGFASSASGKAANRPFTSVTAFGASSLLATNLPSTVTAEDFMTAVGGMMTVRSDTFRVRAYGESLNAADESVESSAYCETIVQRTVESAGTGTGRKFVVTFFRWLGPEDI